MPDVGLLRDLLLLVGLAIPIVALAHRLRLPPLLGFFIAGIVVGPHGFALIDGPEEIETLSELGGEGAVHVSQEVSFVAPVRPGDTVTVVSEVVAKIEERRRLLVDSVWSNQDGVTVVTGTGELL